MRLTLALLAASVLPVMGCHAGWSRWVDRTDLPPVLAETSVEMRDRDGHMLRAFDVENGRVRLAVRGDQVDAGFVDMLVRYEDKRFWRHTGVDARAMGRAVAQALWHRDVVSGGSTLTMQVARLLENGPTGSVRGKLRQMRVAWALERRLTKDGILRLYLQHAPYGGRIEGVRSASLLWFGKEPRRLSPSEAALLVALPQAPETRRPDRFPEQARAARDRVLARLGQAATDAPVPRAMLPVPMQAPHLADALRAADPDARQFDTTLSRGLQSQIATLARAHVARMPARVSAAIVVADHQTGEVLARLGAPVYSDASGGLGFVDMARAVRSPGSTLKPLVYALAFDRGLAHPSTVIADQPMQFGRYAPQNFDGFFRGDIAVRDALAQSLNVPVVALTEALGPDRLMAAMRAFGTNPQLPGDAAPGLAVALGGVGISLDDLVTLYAGMAQQGQARPLHVQAGAARSGSTVLAPRAAWQVGDILANIAPPSGARAGLAYKTGTSYGHRDAWAVGFDGRHVVGVWIGRPDGTPVPGAFGGDVAAPLLFEVFGRLTPDYTPLPPPPTDTLILTQGELPSRLRRFEPTAARDTGPEVTFPPDGALLATPDTVVKVRGGSLPLTVLVNGQPIETRQRGRQIDLGRLGPGYTDISVIDAQGQSAHVTVQARP
ncbi:penicillin-binding protein 1C [uncultured Tateyamaria sp.]|uniref:penicillin-binding protein 1C n=1 Tax=Tateyamaria sp. 1078 TaxID=3417464 RepID=UPI00261E0436|nr:penicillin-binding protein 1C [uncultured Tateyamaria sp.]